jgi:hypothetical protein
MEKQAPVRSFGTLLAKGENGEHLPHSHFLIPLHITLCLNFPSSEHVSCVIGVRLASLNSGHSSKNDR